MVSFWGVKGKTPAMSATLYVFHESKNQDLRFLHQCCYKMFSSRSGVKYRNALFLRMRAWLAVPGHLQTDVFPSQQETAMFLQALITLFPHGGSLVCLIHVVLIYLLLLWEFASMELVSTSTLIRYKLMLSWKPINVCLGNLWGSFNSKQGFGLKMQIDTGRLQWRYERWTLRGLFFWSRDASLLRTDSKESPQAPPFRVLRGDGIHGSDVIRDSYICFELLLRSRSSMVWWKGSSLKVKKTWIKILHKVINCLVTLDKVLKLSFS